MTISPGATVSLDTFFVSTGGFSKVSKFTNDLILCEKFSKPSPDYPFLMTLCFLFRFLSSNSPRYSFGLTSNVNMQGLPMFSVS